MSPAAPRRPGRCPARSPQPTLAGAQPANLGPAACLCSSTFPSLKCPVRSDRSLLHALASARFAGTPTIRSGLRRRLQEMFGHIVDEDAQLRRRVLARRPHDADDSNVLDVFIEDLNQRAFRDWAAHGEVGNTR